MSKLEVINGYQAKIGDVLIPVTDEWIEYLPPGNLWIKVGDNSYAGLWSGFRGWDLVGDTLDFVKIDHDMSLVKEDYTAQ